MIAAILRAQWLSLQTSRLGSRRRGLMFSALVGLMFYGFWILLAFGAAALFSGRDEDKIFPLILASGLMGILFYWQLAPVITASMGASLDLKKLIVYPVPHDQLFVVEVLLRFTTCAEMLIVLAGVFVGLARNPEYGGVLALPRLAAAMLTFVSFNLLLSAGTRNLLERWLLRTRMREVAVLILVLVGFLPQALQAAKVSRAAIERFVPTAPYWPWAAASRMLLGQSIWIALVTSVLYIVLAYWFSRRQFEIGLRYDPSAARAGKSIRPVYVPVEGKQSIPNVLFRLPGRFLRDPIAAVVEKEMRSLLRTPRFRLVFLMACIFGLFMYMPVLLRGKARTGSFMADHFLTISCLYGLLMIGQVTYWNAFGFDRSAVQAYFSFPVSFSKTLAGKNVAVGIFVGCQVLVVIVLAALVHAVVSPVKIAEALVVTVVAASYWLGLGNLSSVHVPRAMDPEKINSMANKMQAVVIWLSPLVLLPIGLAYWARYIFQSDLVFFALMALAGVLGAVLYWVALESAVATAYKRREKMMAALATRDGPLSIT